MVKADGIGVFVPAALRIRAKFTRLRYIAQPSKRISCAANPIAPKNKAFQGVPVRATQSSRLKTGASLVLAAHNATQK